MTATEALRELLAALRACDAESPDCMTDALYVWLVAVEPHSGCAESTRLHAALVAAQEEVERDG